METLMKEKYPSAAACTHHIVGGAQPTHMPLTGLEPRTLLQPPAHALSTEDGHCDTFIEEQTVAQRSLQGTGWGVVARTRRQPPGSQPSALPSTRCRDILPGALLRNERVPVCAEHRMHELELSFVGNTQTKARKGHGMESTEAEHGGNGRHRVKV